ncbi:hypothetical protein [Pseudomonas kurunegalensis]|uniref:hypothetical protein n=1 Tax=Pseudomonas kurunegalensis TaxID=485880 RepID=UPI003A8B396D
MLSILSGFISAVIGLILLILVWPKLWSRRPIVKHSILGLSVLLLAHFVLTLYLSKHPTDAMKADRIAKASADRSERDLAECRNSISAFTAATIKVKHRLKDPETAVFPWPNDSGVRISKISGVCRFEVSASVQAKNSFGATVPTPFDVIVRYDMASTAWVLESIRM